MEKGSSTDQDEQEGKRRASGYARHKAFHWLEINKIMEKPRDVTKKYPVKQFIQKIRRLADGLEAGEQFTIQIAGERIKVPKHAVVSVEHESGENGTEIEFQITWKNEA